MKTTPSFILTVLLLALLHCCPMGVSAQDDDARYATALPKKGTVAPDFKLKTLKGKNFRLSQLKGKLVVLDFWASWCPDCRKDLPQMSRLYKEFSAKGVEFVGVSFDTDREAWQHCVERFGIDYTQVSELKKWKETEVSRQYGVEWIPSMVVVGKDGKIVLSTVMIDKLEKTLNELTAAPIQRNTDSVWIDGSKGRLRAVIQKPSVQTGKPVPMAVLLHGLSANKNHEIISLIADSLQQAGIASIRFDFNGHGESDGSFTQMTVENELEDARQVIGYVQNLPYVSQIALAGHSQGGVVAAMLAGELGKEQISAVVLLAPAGVIRDDALRGNTVGSTRRIDPFNLPDSVEIWQGQYLGREYISTAQRLSIYEKAALYEGKACIIHGNHDLMVPYTYGLRFHEQWKGSQWYELDGFSHSFRPNVYRAAHIAARFLIDTLTDGQ